VTLLLFYHFLKLGCLLLGRFVSALYITPTEPTLLISGGGDAELKVWNWMKGSLRWELRVWEVVERFLVVKAVMKSGWGEQRGDGDGKTGKRKRKRKGKGKGKRNRKEPMKVTVKLMAVTKKMARWQVQSTTMQPNLRKSS
jgi:tRNA (guanine-N(7)-)-methyltransferase subunit TRM82